MGTNRNPDSTVRLLDLSDFAVAQIAALISGGSGPAPVIGTVDQGLANVTERWLVSDTSALSALAAIAMELADKLEPGDSVELGAATIAALRASIDSAPVTVDGTVALDAPTLAALENVVVSGTVALDAGTLAALETINAVVSGTVELGATTLAALESITVTVSGSVAVAGTVALDAPTLAALEHITAAIEAGSVIGLDAATLAALESITVSGTVALDGPTLAALETINAVCSGTVELGAATLAALEAITVTVTGSVAVTGPLTDAELRASPVAVTATEPAPTTLVSFVTPVPTAGTRVQLANHPVAAGILQAPSTNTGMIYVGGSTVSSSDFGAELQPGQATGIAISNTNKLFIDASVNADKCAFLGSL